MFDLHYTRLKLFESHLLVHLGEIAIEKVYSLRFDFFDIGWYMMVETETNSCQVISWSVRVVRTRSRKIIGSSIIPRFVNYRQPSRVDRLIIDATTGLVASSEAIRVVVV